MKKVILVLALSFLCTACSDNDDAYSAAALNGEWVLTNVFCFCFFEPNEDFSVHQLIFDSRMSQVTVINQGETRFFQDSGTYSYRIEKDKITLEGEDRSYTYSIENNTLNLIYVDRPDIADDEISFTYRKK